MTVGEAIKKTAKGLLGAETYCRLRTRYHMASLDRMGRRLLLVHSMGKVGSSSVIRSLGDFAAEQNIEIHHTHFLTPEGSSFHRELEARAFGGWNGVPDQKKEFIIESDVIGQYIRRASGKEFQVVTLVRDPVATNLSAFFYNHHWWPRELEMKCRQGSPECLQELLACFLDSYPHEVPLTWFDTQLEPVFGIDVFASSFPKAEGYKIYHGQVADLLLLKLENLAACERQAFGEFFGIENFALVKTNVAEDIWYSDIYNRFRKTMALPISYVDGFYRDKCAQHFYTSEEIEAFRTKWTQPRSLG